jgi:hypothetical protein
LKADLTDPHAMRAEIERTFFALDASIGCAVAVKAALDVSRHRDLSGEDTWTVVAYYLLQHAQRMEQLAMDQALLRPPNPVLLCAACRRMVQGL